MGRSAMGCSHIYSASLYCVPLFQTSRPRVSKADTNLSLKRPQSNGNACQVTYEIIVASLTMRTREEIHGVVMLEKQLRGEVLTAGTPTTSSLSTPDMAGPN